ncbi:GH92 family glycosyl hydrolase [Sunxiuqinia sp. A32]|uniref:GH92 family glycosyl hydrolase n=1 Tax=Sunxiuqinia sp. A32 TaxID=3461496 RepID=UPI00404618D8
MKRYLTLLVTLFFVGYSYAQQDLVQYVNTLQGSHNTSDFSHGRCSPLVGLPQGANFWSPNGFSIINKTVRGAGGGGFSLTPLVSRADLQEGNFSSGFDPDQVVGSPHYFKVATENGVTTEMTTTERCGYFKFTFPRSKEAFLLYGGGGKTDICINPEKQRITGFVTNQSWHSQARYKTYFIMQFNQPFVAYGTTQNQSKVILDQKQMDSGNGVGAYLKFKNGASVEVVTSISKISAEQAQVTLDREVGSKRFNEIKEQSYTVWNDLLNKILVEGGTEEQRKTFYSCMFRANLRPGKEYEVDKEGNPHYFYGGKIYDGKYHSNPILWDAYRSLFALQNIINTEGEKEYVQSLMKTKELSGWWPSGHVMIGNHAISVLADAWAKGIRTFDPETALKYYYHEITHSVLDSINNSAYNIDHERGYGRMGFENYFSQGYIPYPQNTNRVMETTSKTIEYNYDDFCAYKLAQMTGNKYYEDLFAKHIFNYKNVFDPSDDFFKGRDVEGNFDIDFNPYEWGGAFVEGNGWQWRFAVQQDAQGMMDLMGGEKEFIENLDELFSVRSDSVLHGGYGYWIHEINEAVAGGQGQYAQGNEPCFHNIYLYNHAGQPWKGQKLLRESLTKLYNSGPKGFPGDEDGGAMSSWYVFSAMGFYTVTPGVAQYSLGSPLFNKITITLESGKKFTIVADDNSADNVYIKSATLNGNSYSKNWITHDDIMNGGELHFEMSSKPNKQRGTGDQDKPYSLSKHN